MYKYVGVIFLVLFLLMAFVCLVGCTMYSIKMDHPDNTEFDVTDKRSEPKSGPLKRK